MTSATKKLTKTQQTVLDQINEHGRLSVDIWDREAWISVPGQKAIKVNYNTYQALLYNFGPFGAKIQETEDTNRQTNRRYYTVKAQ